ncbi:MAG: response regulator [Phycisphaerae bacterium]|nr:response regulator [Phycisphaerae bacterium]
MPDKTVLIADDEPYITYMLASRLTERGLKVLTACDGVQALELARTSSPRVIVSDFQMPRMSGLELARTLRGSPETAEIPIIMLTARGHRLTPTELRETNIQHLMFKPFSARELTALLDEYMEAGNGADEPRTRREAA